MVDTDRITGAARQLGGKVQGAFGDLTGSRRDAVSRAAPARPPGQAESLYGQAKEPCATRPTTWPTRPATSAAGPRRRRRSRGTTSRPAARRAQGAAHDQYARAERGVRHAAEEADERSPRTPTRAAAGLRRGTREVGEQVAAYPLPPCSSPHRGLRLGLLVSARRA